MTLLLFTDLRFLEENIFDLGFNHLAHASLREILVFAPVDSTELRQHKNSINVFHVPYYTHVPLQAQPLPPLSQLCSF